jgi:hypothetical protein
MNRRRLSPASPDPTQARIVWRDGLFRVECTGNDNPMRLCVYYGRFLMANEAVESAEVAWQRGTEICRQLGGGDMATYKRGSA